VLAVIEGELMIHVIKQVNQEDKTGRAWKELILRLAQIMEFIGNCIDHNRKLLICCEKGISTGPTALIAYLLLKARYRIKTSLEHLQEIRPEVKPCPSFWQGLIDLEENLFVKKLKRFDMRMRACELYDID